MNQKILQYKRNLDKAKSPQLNSDNLYNIYSAERTIIYPSEKIFVKTFLDIKIKNDYIGIILPDKDIYYKYGIQAFKEVIYQERKDLQILLTNVNIPKQIFMQSDKERFFGEKNKHNIFVGDKIAQLLILRKESIEHINE